MPENKISEELQTSLDGIKSSIDAKTEALKKDMGDVADTKATALIDAYKKEVGDLQVELDKKQEEKDLAFQKNLDDLDKRYKEQKSIIPVNMSLKQRLHRDLTGSEAFAKHVANIDSNKGSNNFTLDLKAVGDITSGNQTTAITEEFTPGMLEMEVNRISKRQTFIQSLINTATLTNTRTVSWWEQTTTEGGVATRAENATMTQVDYDWTRNEEALKFISGFVKVTNEALGDWGQLEAEIQFELFRDMNLELDDQLLNGDGTGNNLNGIITQATTFAAGAFALAIEGAQEYDVLRVALNQIALNNFFPTVVVLHPDDASQLDLLKISDGRYLLAPFVSADNTVIKGIPIVENQGIATDNFLVMDGSRATAFFRQGITLRIWDQNEDDPIFNRQTMTANVEVLNRIKGNDTGAFITGDFTTAKAALETA